MGIGTSLGAFFNDDHHYNAALWDPNRFEGDRLMEKTPNAARTDKALDDAELDPSTGMGIEVGYKQWKSDPSKFARNKNYDTILPKSIEEEYSKKFKPEDSHDYDMRGWYFQKWLDNPLSDVKVNKEGEHYPDTFKKPNHPTFSMDSVMNGIDGQYGGVWGTEESDLTKIDTFKPSSTNLKNLGKEGLQDYFKRVEPKAKLLLDEPDIEDRRDDTNLETYQEILDGQKRGSTYFAEDNKLLENRRNTPLENEAGAGDLDKMELDSLVKLVRRGMGVK